MKNYTQEMFTEDKEIAEEVFRIHFRRLFYLQEDLVQEALKDIVRYRPKFAGKSSYKTYASEVSHNAMLMLLRKEKRHIVNHISMFDQLKPNEDKTYMDTIASTIIDIEHLKLIEQLEKLRHDFVQSCVDSALRMFNGKDRKIAELITEGLAFRDIEERLELPKTNVARLAKKFRNEVAKEIYFFDMKGDFMKANLA